MRTAWFVPGTMQRVARAPVDTDRFIDDEAETARDLADEKADDRQEGEDK